MSRKKIVIIGIVLIVLLNLIGLGTLIESKVRYHNKTTTTTVIEEKLVVDELNNNINSYNLKLREINKANKYKVDITDDTNQVVLSLESEKNTLDFTLPVETLIYNKNFFISAISYQDDKELKKLNEPYKFVWNEPSINIANVHDINNVSNYVLKIDGELNEKHKIVIKSGDTELLTDTALSNDYVVPSKLFKNKNIDLNILLYSNDVIVSSFNSNNKYIVSEPKTTKPTKPKNPISDVVITNPKNYLSLKDIVDVNVNYTGGDGATSTSIYIYENNNLVKSEVLTSKSYVIPSSMLKKESGYRVVVEAINGDFKKSDSVYISTITNGRNKMVELARAQVGNTGEKYWSWWGYKGFVEWCAIFVSWVSNQNGYLDAGVIPKFQGVRTGVNWFKERNQFKSRSSGYVPQPGDVIFFDYHPENSLIDHVGLVEYSDGVNVYTIEGNTGKKPNRVCAKKTYPINSSKIYGYGVPNY